MDPNENDFQAKKESESKFPEIAPSSRHRSSYKNPRIVRVSRAFGGKDRHSKVCTVRGLRDRRIRLSVPTAIQLYDLQDKLGLGQPSKVVDWLLDITKSDIDKLPPLPSLNFTQFQESCASTSQSSLPHFFLTPNQQKNLGSFKGGIKVNEGENKWMDQENREGLGGFVEQNLFPLSNSTGFQSSYPNMHYNSSNNFSWDLPNLSLSQFGGGFSLPARTDDHLSVTSGSHPYFSPFATNTPSVFPSFPPFLTASSDTHDVRQANHLHQNSFTPTTTLHLISPKAAFPQESDNQEIEHKENRNIS